MNKTLNIPFIILTISLIVGIVFEYYISIQVTLICVLQIALLIGLALSRKYANRPFKKSYIFTTCVVLNFICIGALLVAAHHPENNVNHYIHSLPKKPSKEGHSISFHIKKQLKSTSYYHNYIISLQSIENKATCGDLLLQIPNKNLEPNPVIGNLYGTHTQVKPIPTPLNPYQFDYASYLDKQYIFHKITIDYAQLIHIDQHIVSIYSLAHKIRLDIQKKLQEQNFSKSQLSIINALLLGQRQDIDQNLISDYQNAGAIHILAVSGLHVGILLMLINFILKPLEYIRNGERYKTILAILLLWSFAIIAGLSPSVLRAVTMFTCIAIGMQIRSKTSVYNALFISMFFLLCIEPLLLFSVGFQLSYIAVFAIVWIQPILAKIYSPRFYIDKILWDTLTVTIAAQLGVLPLTLFYFHQFPLLFFVSNLIIIPFLGIILAFGILVLVLAKLQLLMDWIVTVFGNCIDGMNAIVHWVSQQDGFILTHISFSWKMLVGTYALIYTSILVFNRLTKTTLYYVLISVLLVLSILVYENNIHHTKQELVIFHHQRNTTIGVLQNKNLHIYSKDSISQKVKKMIFDNYIISNNTTYRSRQKLKNIYTYHSKTILIIDSTAIYQIPNLQPDIILLTGSPKIHLERLIKELHPKQIIADGNNYKSYLDQWERTCAKKKTPFHRTDQKGAFIMLRE